jgi:hypothetical protein
MTRIAVVGNSHVGALKLGWERVAARHPGLQVEFFAAPGGHFNRLQMFAPLKFGAGPKTVNRSAGRVEALNGRRWIDLAPADVVMLVGRSGGLGIMAALLAEHDVDGLPETDREMPPRRLSAAAYDAFCDAVAERSLTEPWSSFGSRPRLVLLPRTRPSEAALRGPATSYNRPWRQLARTPDKLDAGVERYLDRLAARLAASGGSLLRQPPASLAASGLTREDMTRGSLRTDGSTNHSQDDAAHANADYGALFWESCGARLSETGLAADPLPA